MLRCEEVDSQQAPTCHSINTSLINITELTWSTLLPESVHSFNFKFQSHRLYFRFYFIPSPRFIIFYIVKHCHPCTIGGTRQTFRLIDWNTAWATTTVVNYFNTSLFNLFPVTLYFYNTWSVRLIVGWALNNHHYYPWISSLTTAQTIQVIVHRSPQQYRAKSVDKVSFCGIKSPKTIRS